MVHHTADESFARLPEEVKFAQVIVGDDGLGRCEIVLHSGEKLVLEHVQVIADQSNFTSSREENDIVSSSQDLVEESNRLVLALIGVTEESKDYLRAVLVALDALQKTLVEGISPLYKVLPVYGDEVITCVVQLSSALPVEELFEQLERIHHLVEVAHQWHAIPVAVNEMSLDPTAVLSEAAVDLLTDIHLPLSLTKSAALLSPWMDMDVQAQVDGDPVSYRLAMAEDGYRAVMIADNWILG